jgi:L-threonylcarbamoyladenylate synthase
MVGYNPPDMTAIDSRKPSVYSIDADHPDPEVIQRAAECLIRGGLVAFPTETVYGLGGNAFDREAVQRIFTAKERPPTDPLIVHIAQADDVHRVAREVPPVAWKLADRFWPGPLTLLLPRAESLPSEVSAHLDTVAVRVPSHPVAQALLQAAGIPIAAPSANRFAHTSPTHARHVADDLGGRVDIILDAGPASWGVESTILDPLQTPPVLLRPGAVTLEELEDTVGPVRIARPDERISASPGRQPRHYAPDARLILCREESPDAIVRALSAAAVRLTSEGRRVGLAAASEICRRKEMASAKLVIRDLGPQTDIREISRRLFAALRELEAEGVDTILAHRVPSEGLGAAINDRLTRAAREFLP